MGNERADRLVSNASVSESQHIDRFDTMGALGERRRDKYPPGASLAINRQNVRTGTAMAAARMEPHTNRTGRFINQQRMGTINRLTLQELLQRTSGPLWAYAECSDDHPLSEL